MGTPAARSAATPEPSPGVTPRCQAGIATAVPPGRRREFRTVRRHRRVRGSPGRPRPAGTARRFANTDAGLRRLATFLAPVAPTRAAHGAAGGRLRDPTHRVPVRADGRAAGPPPARRGGTRANPATAERPRTGARRPGGSRRRRRRRCPGRRKRRSTGAATAVGCCVRVWRQEARGDAPAERREELRMRPTGRSVPVTTAGLRAGVRARWSDGRPTTGPCSPPRQVRRNLCADLRLGKVGCAATGRV